MKENQRFRIVQDLVNGKIKNVRAASLLNISVRQVYRLKAKAKELGVTRVIHGNTGRTPYNKIDQKVWDEVLSLARSRYADMNNGQLQKTLARNHNIRVGRESLRKRLRAAGIPPLFRRSKN